MVRAHPQRFELLWHLAELHNLTFALRMFPPPTIILGLLRPAKIGLARKRDDTRNDKTPVSVCQAWSLSDWHLLAQAHPGSREARDKSQTQMAFFFFLCNSVSRKIQNEGKEKKLFSNPHPVFTDSLKYNCLYKNIRNQRVSSYCSGVLVFFW